jgi:hypothetical protein
VTERKPTLREKLAAIGEKLLAKMNADSAPATPQRELADKAMISKRENAHRLAPRHPPHPLCAPRTSLVITGDVFVTWHPKFPGNPCYVRRGMDRPTVSAAMRGLKRDKEKGYLRPSFNFEKLGDAWAKQQAALGLQIVTANCTLKEWQWDAKAAAAAATA